MSNQIDIKQEVITSLAVIGACYLVTEGSYRLFTLIQKRRHDRKVGKNFKQMMTEVDEATK